MPWRLWFREKKNLNINHLTHSAADESITRDAGSTDTGAMLPPPFKQPPDKGAYRVRLILSVSAALITYIIGQVVYLDAPVTTDENSYVFQANLFLEGHLKRPAPDYPKWFKSVMIVLDDDAGWFSRYPPAHSLWLAPGVLLGQPRIMSAIAAGVSVWLLTGVATLLGAPALLVGLGLLLSPYFLFMHGTLLSHTSAMMAVALMLYGYVHWSVRRSPTAIAIAGCAWSFLYLDRPYTAALVAIPFAAHALVTLWREPDKRTWLGIIVFGICTSSGILLGLWYNALTTGDPFLPPFVYYDSSRSCGLGFDMNHTPRVAFRYLATNIKMLDEWLMGFHGGLFIYVVLILLGWTMRWSLFALAGILLIVSGHLLFCYPGVNICGPFYYFESLPFFILCLALAGHRLWIWTMRKKALRVYFQYFWLLVLVILSVTSLRFMIKQGITIRAYNEILAQLMTTARTAPPHSIVLVKNVDETLGLNLSRLLFNPKGIKSDPLIMPGLHNDNFVVARFFPNRRLWLLDGLEPDHLTSWVATTQRMDRVIDLSSSHSFVGQILRQDKRCLREAIAGRDGKGYAVWGNYMLLYPGSFEIVFQLDCVGVSSNAPVACDMVTDRGRKILGMQSISGKNGPCQVILPFHISQNTEVEPRVYYGGSGRLIVQSIILRESN